MRGELLTLLGAHEGQVADPVIEAYYTPGVDEICGQVQRQLMRNELARFYYHRIRKCMPPRKLRRDIQ
jgi:hypothetical protein